MIPGTNIKYIHILLHTIIFSRNKDTEQEVLYIGTPYQIISLQ